MVMGSYLNLRLRRDILVSVIIIDMFLNCTKYHFERASFYDLRIF